MATSTNPHSTTTDGGHNGVTIPRRDDTRLSTETKAAPKTTEFIAYIAILAGLFITGLVVDSDGRGDGGFSPQEVWFYATLLTIGYMISRGLAKAGSSDPYWAGGTNQNRDND